MIRQIASLLALLLAGCLPAGESAGERGGPADPAHPSIVSLNPCSDAILTQLAHPDQLLAISHYSHDPAATSMDIDAARRWPAIGGTLEEILALHPDVVVAGAYLPPPLAQGIRDAGMRLLTLPMPVTIAQSQEQVRTLARLAGNRAAGERMVQRIVRAEHRFASPPQEPRLAALVWESGGIVAGKGTLITDLLAQSGFSNGAAARGLDQAEYLSLERLIADLPQVVFTVGQSRGEEDRLLSHPALARVPGMVRAPLEPGLLWCGGPTIPRALARLAAVRKDLRP